MKRLIIVFLFLANISFSQELGILLKTIPETETELNRIFLKYKFICDTIITTQLSETDGFIFRFTNNYCFHEEFITTNLFYNTDSIKVLLENKCKIYKENIYYYEIGNYRFYYIIVKNDNFIKIIKTIRENVSNNKTRRTGK